MIDALFSTANYVGAKKLLDATSLRQEAIASNLANLETPHYKRLDVAPSFSAELSQAVASQDPARIASLQPQMAVDTAATDAFGTFTIFTAFSSSSSESGYASSAFT